MTTYRRDDAAFRAHIRRLADAGLVLDVKGKGRVESAKPNTVSGLIWWSPVIAILIAGMWALARRVF